MEQHEQPKATYILVFQNDVRECYEDENGNYVHVLNPAFVIAKDDPRIIRIS